MKCQKCDSCNTRVTSNRSYPDYTKRYCRCLDCGHRYRTVETYQYKKPGPPKQRPRPGKIVRGESHGQSFLNEQNVIDIRAMRDKGHTLREIATKYGISPPYVSRIVNRQNWTHI